MLNQPFTILGVVLSWSFPKVSRYSIPIYAWSIQTWEHIRAVFIYNLTREIAFLKQVIWRCLVQATSQLTLLHSRNLLRPPSKSAWSMNLRIENNPCLRKVCSMVVLGLQAVELGRSAKTNNQPCRTLCGGIVSQTVSFHTADSTENHSPLYQSSKRVKRPQQRKALGLTFVRDVFFQDAGRLRELLVV